MTHEMICTRCGHAGTPALATPGSILVELVLWLCLIVPGLIYSLWRLSRRHEVCKACGATQLVPLDSPVGRELAARYLPAVVPPETVTPSPLAYKTGRVLGALLGRR